MSKILVVDDEVEVCDLLKSILELELNCEVHLAYDGHEAYQKLKASKFDLIITDFKMPIMDGAALISAIKTTDTPSKDAIIFLVSGHIENPQNGPDIIKNVLFFDKPFNVKRLLVNARMALSSSAKNKAV